MDHHWWNRSRSRVFMKIYPSVKTKMGERKSKTAKRQKRIRNKSALQTHKHIKSLCVKLVSSCRLTQKECPEACWHAHRKMRFTAVIFKPFAGPPLRASVTVPVSQNALKASLNKTDKKLQTSGVKWAERWRIWGVCLITNPQEKREQNKQTINTICTNIYLYRQHRVELWVAYVNLVLLLAGVAAWVGGWPARLLSVWSAGCLRTCFW